MICGGVWGFGKGKRSPFSSGAAKRGKGLAFDGTNRLYCFRVTMRSLNLLVVQFGGRITGNGVGGEVIQVR